MMGLIANVVIFSMVLCILECRSPPKRITVRPPAGVHPTPGMILGKSCIPYRTKGMRIYEYGGCKVKVDEKGCAKITDCPLNGDCYDSEGGVRTYTEKWTEAQKLCRCAYLRQFIASPIPPPMYGPPFPALRYCRLNGCRHPVNKKNVVKGGDAATDKNGDTCTCAAGPDKRLKDAATLFHWECEEGITPWMSI
ncbi:uncharacterized protein LOC141902500 [Tubulanus polymorphus]|uniref:uncharacterized protein LOC141902500 n=1 Tax=Tubulanus polymorphus TaxID=672921 RepID=UPI003DA2AA78